MSNEIEKLLELIGNLVTSDGTWKEKRDRILSGATDEEKTNLAEFVGWFEESSDS